MRLQFTNIYDENVIKRLNDSSYQSVLAVQRMYHEGILKALSLSGDPRVHNNGRKYYPLNISSFIGSKLIKAIIIGSKTNLTENEVSALLGKYGLIDTKVYSQDSANNVLLS